MKGRKRRLLLPAVLGVLFAAPSVAQEAGAPERVDIKEKPWTAIGQVNNSAYGRCTGILLSREVAVTAAHCLFNKGTGQFMRPQSIHFVLGYDRGAYAFQTVAREIKLGPAYDPKAPMDTIADDWALLSLQEPAPEGTAFVEPAPGRLEEGASLISAGFAQSRLYALTAVRPCPVLGQGPHGTLAVGCRIEHGYSGGPLLDEDGRLVGIQVAGGKTQGRDFALAVPVASFALRKP